MASDEGIDSAADQLRDTVAKLGEGLKEFEKIDSKLEELCSGLATNTGQLEKKHESLEDLAEEFVERIEKAGSGLESQKEGLEKAIETGSGIVEQVSDWPGAGGRELCDVLKGQNDKVKDAESGVSEKLDSWHEKSQALAADMESMREGIESSFQEAKSSLESLGDGLKGSYEETSGGVGEVSGELKEALVSELKERLEGVAGKVADELTDHTNDTISQTVEGFAEISSGFDGASEELADRMSEEVESLLEEFAEYGKGRITEEVNEAVEELIKETIEAFMAEIVQNVAMSQTGVSTTSTMSPVLPQLVAAKKALEIINKFL